jgi:hypothetical protein
MKRNRRFLHRSIVSPGSSRRPDQFSNLAKTPNGTKGSGKENAMRRIRARLGASASHATDASWPSTARRCCWHLTVDYKRFQSIAAMRVTTPRILRPQEE